MMDNSRIAINSFFRKLIFSIIIVSIILTGMNNYPINDRKNYVVKVNGKEIDRKQFETFFIGEYNRIQKQLGDQFSKLSKDEDHIKSLRQQILYRLIDEVLLDQYIERLGLKISDEQVRNAIFSTQKFQKNGKFNKIQYNTIINQMGIRADQYAQAIRSQLAKKQLIDAIINTDFMLKDEIDRLVSLIMQQRIVREAFIDVNMSVAKQKVNENEVQTYYENNKTSFVTPEQFRLSYIKLNVDETLENVSENEIQSYYDQHQDQFIQAQRKLYKIIQTKTESDAQAILEELNNGADFSTIAKTKSTDVISAKNGGNIGWLEEVAVPKELRNAYLKDKGQLSNIIKSSKGFLIVKLDDIQPEKIKSLSEVRDFITTKVKQKKSLDVFSVLQQKVGNAASNNNESLKAAEKVSGVKVIETDWFGRNNLPQELNFKSVANVIFNGSLLDKYGIPNGNSDVITVNDKLAFVLRILEYKPETINPLDVVRNQIITMVKYNKASQQTKMYAEKLLAKLKVGKEEEVLKTVNLSFSSARTFSRIDQNPVSQAVFSLSLPSEGRPSYGITSDKQGNITLLALDKVETSIISEDQKKAMTKAITQNNTQIIFEALISNLRKKARIKFGEVLFDNNDFDISHKYS